jgi:PAS domain S-box-containing protein
MNHADEDWLDDKVRLAATEMLEVLFGSSRIGVVTFDSKGIIVGVNPQTAELGGQTIGRYRGVSLRETPILRRLGLSEALEHVLDGVTVELTDTRWVTLFSGEERWLDIIAGPVVMEARVVGGVAYLVDSTAMHMAAQAEAAKRRRARELTAFLARDVAEQMQLLTRWAEEPDARDAIGDLRAMLEDLDYFLRIETWEPEVQRFLLDPQLANATAVMGDARLFRRILSILNQFRLREGGARWQVEAADGRVVIECRFPQGTRLPEKLLSAQHAARPENERADSSLAAARWMAELMGATLSIRADTLRFELPAADQESAAANP